MNIRSTTPNISVIFGIESALLGLMMVDCCSLFLTSIDSRRLILIRNSGSMARI